MTTKETTQTIEQIAELLAVDPVRGRVYFEISLTIEDWEILQRPQRGVASVVFDLEVPPLSYIEDPI